MTSLVFVYGTLLRGQGNNRLLDGARFIERTSTAAAFSLYDFGGFPAAVAGGATSILGEVYEVDATTLARLDRLEGHPRMYCRTPITLRSGLCAELYLMTFEQVLGRRLIASGDWLERQRAR